MSDANKWDVWSPILEAQQEVDWSKFLMENAQAAYTTAAFGGNDVEVLTIGAQPGTVAELKTEIRHAGGAVDTTPGNPRVKLARDNWWIFSVEISKDGAQARITENSYLLYGGLGLLALFGLIAVEHGR